MSKLAVRSAVVASGAGLLLVLAAAPSNAAPNDVSFDAVSAGNGQITVNFSNNSSVPVRCGYAAFDGPYTATEFVDSVVAQQLLDYGISAGGNFSEPAADQGTVVQLEDGSYTFEWLCVSDGESWGTPVFVEQGVIPVATAQPDVVILDSNSPEFPSGSCFGSVCLPSGSAR